MFVLVIPIPQPVTELSQTGTSSVSVKVDSTATTATVAFIDKLISCPELAPYIKEVALGQKGTECVIGVDPMTEAGAQ